MNPQNEAPQAEYCLPGAVFHASVCDLGLWVVATMAQSPKRTYFDKILK